MTQAQVRLDTGEILAIGYFPTPPVDDDIVIVDLTDEQLEAVAERGTSVLGEDGTIVTEMPVAPKPVEQPLYGDDGDMDNTTVRETVANLRMFVGASAPSNEALIAVVKLLCMVALHYLKRQVRLV
jgi:hypothetical protein